MKNNSIKQQIYPKIIWVLLIGFLFTSACKEKVKDDPSVFYTCSMDPQVIEKKPGKCPICKMELTRTVVNKEEDQESIKLSNAQIQLANIKIKEVVSKSMGEGISLRGVVVQNDKNIELISSRVPGRVDKLYFKNAGEKIKAGDHVYDIYSEELEASIQQYLLIKTKAEILKGNNVNYEQMLQASRDKLIVWGLSPTQIVKLDEGQIKNSVPFYSKVNGTVSEVLISEGDYVNEGTALIDIANYSSLWVEAEAYPADMKYISVNQKVKLKIETFANEVIEGKISFVNPELEANTKVSIVRIEILNKEEKYKPGMRATVSLLSSEKKTLSIPEGAVLFEPAMDLVFVQKESGAFIPKMVTVGVRYNGYVEIKSGLLEGEKVVVSGAYLLYSEYMLRKGSTSIINKMPGMEAHSKK